VRRSFFLGTVPIINAKKEQPCVFANAIVGIEIVIDRIEGKWKTEPPPRVRTTPGAGPVNAGS